MSEILMKATIKQKNHTELSTDMSFDNCNNFLSSSSDDDDDNNFSLNNILRLQLKKPEKWKWELTTSKSSSNIEIPRIMLFNKKGVLIADANGNDEQIFKSHSMKNENQKKSKFKNQMKKIILQNSDTIDRDFDCLKISKVDDEIRINQNQNQNNNNKLTPTSTSTTTTATSSLSGPREKRKIRRTNTTGKELMHSESILERRSAYKERLSSSPEEETDEYIRPKYYLKTSRAGTLIIAEDSFNLKHRKPLRHRRRRLKNASSSDSVVCKEIQIKNQTIGNFRMKTFFSHKDKDDVLNESISSEEEENEKLKKNHINQMNGLILSKKTETKSIGRLSKESEESNGSN